jgi:hypothetical protein
MSGSGAGWSALKQGLAGLRRLRALPIDLQRVALIREGPPERLSRPEELETLLLQLGLNDEGMHEFPPSLHPYCGQGLRIWQYPIQFSRYLAHLSGLKVRSYLEMGVRHGGAFVATVEVLERFAPLDFAVGVDIIPCPALEEYGGMNPRAEFVRVNTQSAEFGALLDRLGPVDLVFIDSHHEEAQCRRELESLHPRASMFALHDIANVDWPGVRVVWEEMKSSGTYDCWEFTDQYGGLGPYMGIGLAVKKERRKA